MRHCFVATVALIVLILSDNTHVAVFFHPNLQNAILPRETNRHRPRSTHEYLNHIRTPETFIKFHIVSKVDKNVLRLQILG